MNRKANLSMWTWVSAGIIMSIIIFSIALVYLNNLIDDKKERDMITSFELIKNKVNMWCYQYRGSRTEGLYFPINDNLKRLFITNETYFLVYESNRDIYLNSTTIGDVFCMELESNTEIDNIRCYKLNCNIRMKEINLNKNKFLYNLIKNSESTIYYNIILYKNTTYVEVSYNLIS